MSNYLISVIYKSFETSSVELLLLGMVSLTTLKIGRSIDTFESVDKGIEWISAVDSLSDRNGDNCKCLNEININ